jgi:hypothetical protein
MIIDDTVVNGLLHFLYVRNKANISATTNLSAPFIDYVNRTARAYMASATASLDSVHALETMSATVCHNKAAKASSDPRLMLAFPLKRAGRDYHMPKTVRKDLRVTHDGQILADLSPGRTATFYL